MFLQVQNLWLSPLKFPPRWHCLSHIGKFWSVSNTPRSIRDHQNIFNYFRRNGQLLTILELIFTRKWVQKAVHHHCAPDKSPVTACDKTITLCFVRHLKHQASVCRRTYFNLCLHASISHWALDAKIPCNNTFQILGSSHCVLPRRKMEIIEPCLPQ